MPSGSARLYVRDVGEGVPIIVAHGGPDFDHAYLLPELDRLAESFRLIYYDQRGRGRSSAGVRAEDVTIRTEVEDLDNIRQFLGLDSVVVLGHSWGGLLAMEYAIRRPGGASHLILMNTAPASRVDAQLLRQALTRMKTPAQNEAMQEIEATPEYLSGDRDADAQYYRIHFGVTLTDPVLLERLVIRLRSLVNEDGIILAREIEQRLYDETWSVEGFDLIPLLAQLDVPTLVLRGEHDFIPADISRHIADAIRGSRFVELPHCGHFAYMEQPDQVHSQIANFLTT